MSADQTNPAPSPAPAATPAPSTRPQRGLRRVGTLLLSLPGRIVSISVGLLLAGLLALGLWAGSEGSLAQALGWAQGWMQGRAAQTGTLELRDVRGSVLRGGQIGQLGWSREGLSVQARGVQLQLSRSLWLGLLSGRGASVDGLHLAQLTVSDQRPPRPDTAPEPLPAITLPLAVRLPWSVGTLVLEGATPVTLSDIRGLYRYDAGTTPTHGLDLQSLQVAGGRYRAQATLGAQAPMPLRLSAQGEVQTHVPGGEPLRLDARAEVSGPLSGSAGDTIDIQLQLEPSGSGGAQPTLAATARVQPWAEQPLAEVDARLQRLNLASLWPSAPVTDLSGTVNARPDGERWQAQAQLANAASGPLDRQRLPVQSLEVSLEQAGTRWTLTALDAQVGGGRLQGQGWREALAGAPLGQWDGELRASGLNPVLIWSTLAPAALDGTASAQSVNRPGAAPAIDLQARVAPSARQPRASALAGLRLRELHVQGRWTPATTASTANSTNSTSSAGRIELREARLDLANASLQAQGTAELPALDIDGRLTLQLPGLQGQVQGRLAHAQGSGELDLQLSDAAQLLAWLRSLQDLPQIGPALHQLLDARPELQLAGNAQAQARWQGGLGALGYPGTGSADVPRLQLQLNADALQMRSGGPANVTATTLNQLRLHAEGPADRLALTLAAQGTQGPWRAELNTSGQLRLGRDGQPGVDTGRLVLDPLRLQATDSARADRTVDWTLQSTGPLALAWQDTGGRWQADAAQLRLQPRFLSRNGTPPPELQALTLAWDALTWQAGALQSRGRLDGLPLSWVDALATPEGASSGPLARAGLGGDLVFDGRWDIQLPADSATAPRLSAQLTRRSGDLAVQTDGPFDEAALSSQRLQAGVRTAELSLQSEGRALNARLRWDSERLGEASADLGTTLSPPDALHSTWHWPDTAPLRGQLRASLPQVGVWSALAPPGWRVRGTLALEAALAGTRAAPQWSGSLQARDVALRSLVNGIAFVNGELRATLAGEKLVIERFSLDGRGGAERGGTLVAQGSAEWRAVTREGRRQREPYIELQATASKWRVSTRADRRLTLSGQVNALLAGPDLRLRGELKADSALVILPDEMAPSLGSDVVLRGTELPPEGAGLRVRPDVQVGFDLGDDFQLRGQGVQTRLAGRLDVRTTPARPTPLVLGEVRTAAGSYRAYGQQLTIETGVLRFTGPYDNPTLDITAIRPNTRQRVGVQVSGTAQTPRVRLFSDPELPDSEKLAWLVLGRPASGAGAEAAVLQQAALALLAGNNGAASGGVAGALGLDDLSFSGNGTNTDGSARTAAITLGKRLSNDLYVSYERSLVGVLGTVSIFYDVSRRFTIRARAGEENAVDLIFTLQYD